MGRYRHGRVVVGTRSLAVYTEIDVMAVVRA